MVVVRRKGSKAKFRRVLIKRKDGRKQHYLVKKRNFKKKYKYNKRSKVWSRIIIENFYRISFVLMFYANEQKKFTPMPFAEFRVWLITKNASIYKTEKEKKRFKGFMMGLLRCFPSVWHLWRFGNLIAKPNPETEFSFKMQIVGLEFERIDADEVEQNFKTNGYKQGFLDYHYRYAAFFGPSGKIRKDYNERELRRFCPRK